MVIKKHILQKTDGNFYAFNLKSGCRFPYTNVFNTTEKNISYEGFCIFSVQLYKYAKSIYVHEYDGYKCNNQIQHYKEQELDLDFINISDVININDEPLINSDSTIIATRNINLFSEDQDSDEVPDCWEYKYYKNLDNSTDSDTDEDGLNLFEEYILGSNPLEVNNNTLYVNCNSELILCEVLNLYMIKFLTSK